MIAKRRGAVALAATLVAGGLAAVALGQDFMGAPLGVAFNVSPNNAGTPSRPQGVVIGVKGALAVPEGGKLPVARSFDVWLPAEWVYNGGKHPVCTVAKLNRGGPRTCPRGSIMGHTAAPYDPVPNRPPSVTVVNGGPTRMYFWAVLHDPARVQAAIPGVLTKLRSSRWSYRLHADIPGRLQVVAGIPITLSSFRARAGRGDWIATTGCPRNHLWRFHVRLTPTTGQALDLDSSVACRRN